MSDESFYADLERYDNDFVPQAAFRPSLDTIPDGDYSFEIIDAIPDRTKNSKDPILRVGLRVDGGIIVERGYLFTSQEGVNRFGADLCTLGIPVDQKSPFSKQLQTAVPKLKGVKFRARKSTDRAKNSDKAYTNLLIISLDNGKANRPAKPVPLQSPPAINGNVGSEDVPF